MYIGTQGHFQEDVDLEVLAQLGVNNIDFRNIQGGLRKFVEVFPDEGDVDMLEVLRTLKEVDYPYMIMPDHVPRISGPEARRVAFAYTYGYIHAALQAVNR